MGCVLPCAGLLLIHSDRSLHSRKNCSPSPLNPHPQRFFPFSCLPTTAANIRVGIGIGIGVSICVACVYVTDRLRHLQLPPLILVGRSQLLKLNLHLLYLRSLWGIVTSSPSRSSDAAIKAQLSSLIFSHPPQNQTQKSYRGSEYIPSFYQEPKHPIRYFSPVSSRGLSSVKILETLHLPSESSL